MNRQILQELYKRYFDLLNNNYYNYTHLFKKFGFEDIYLNQLMEIVDVIDQGDDQMWNGSDINITYTKKVLQKSKDILDNVSKDFELILFMDNFINFIDYLINLDESNINIHYDAKNLNRYNFNKLLMNLDTLITFYKVTNISDDIKQESIEILNSIIDMIIFISDDAVDISIDNLYELLKDINDNDETIIDIKNILEDIR